MAISRRAGVRRRVSCRCSRPVSGAHPGQALHRRSGEQRDPQVVRASRATRPPKRPGGKGHERYGRRASLQPPPAGSPVRRALSAVVDPRLARPPAEASCVAGRLSRTRPEPPKRPVTASMTHCTIVPERRRRLRRPLSSVKPDIGTGASARHRRCTAQPGAGPVRRRVGRSLTTVTRTLPRRLRAQRAHRSTWSSSLKARLRLGSPSARSHADCHQGLGGVATAVPGDPLAASRSASRVSSARSPAWTARCTVHGWPSHGVGCPTTLTEAGSDLHRAYHTRLCCAFRLSQPPDALFRPQPLRPCFMPVTSLGFRFQRVPLPGSGCVSRRDLPSLPFRSDPSTTCQDGDRIGRTATRICASRESVPRGPVLPGSRRSCLS
jgi:hypothetical protein